MKLVFLIAVPFAIFFMVFAKRLVSVIYPALTNEQLFMTANLLKIASFNVVTLSAMQIYVSLMQAVDRTKKAVLSLGYAILVKVILQLVLTRFIGIYGSALASVAMGSVALVLAYASYFEVCGLHIEKNIAINLVCGVIMGLVGIVISVSVQNDFLALAVGIAACLAVYVWTVFLFGLIGREELADFPAGKLLAKIHRVVRFWEYK